MKKTQVVMILFMFSNLTMLRCLSQSFYESTQYKFYKMNHQMRILVTIRLKCFALDSLSVCFRGFWRALALPLSSKCIIHGTTPYLLYYRVSSWRPREEKASNFKVKYKEIE